MNAVDLPWTVLRAELLESCFEDLQARGFETSHPDAEVRTALQRPWSLLTDAGSCVVFTEPTNQYILKLFKSPDGVIRKFHHVWKSMNLSLSSWTPYPGDVERSAEFKVSKTLYSVAFSAQHFKKETAIIYAHLLAESEQKFSLMIENEILDAQNVPFILQRHVEPLENRLIQAVKDRHFDKGRRLLDDFLTFIEICWKQGITDSPFNFGQNYGYITENQTERFVQFDVGDFHFGKRAIQHELTDRAVLRNYSFRWLSELSSELAEYLNGRVHEQFQIKRYENVLNHLPNEIRSLSYFNEQNSRKI